MTQRLAPGTSAALAEGLDPVSAVLSEHLDGTSSAASSAFFRESPDEQTPAQTGSSAFPHLPHQEWPILEDAAYHGLAGEIVRAIEPHTEADPVALLVNLLVSVGNLVGPAGPHLIAGGHHPGRLNAVLVGNTARARKGTSWWEISRLLKLVDREWADHRVLDGLSSGEGLISTVADPEEDDKGEAIDLGALDKRLLIYEPEFARLLAVANRDQSILSAVIRQAWDTGTLNNITRKDKLHASGAHISILGNITFDELKDRLGSSEAANGFANRFMFFAVKRSKDLPHGGDLDYSLLDYYASSLEGVIRKASSGGGVLTRTTNSYERWSSLYKSFSDKEGLVGALLARGQQQVMRLSVIYTLLDGATQIDDVHQEAAMALWRYCEKSTSLIFGEDSTGNPTADKLLNALKAEPGGLNARQMDRLFAGHTKATERAAAIALLQERGLAYLAKVSTGGAPRHLLLPGPPP